MCYCVPQKFLLLPWCSGSQGGCWGEIWNCLFSLLTRCLIAQFALTQKKKKLLIASWLIFLLVRCSGAFYKYLYYFVFAVLHFLHQVKNLTDGRLIRHENSVHLHMCRMATLWLCYVNAFTLAVALNCLGTKGDRKLNTKIETGFQGATCGVPYLQSCITASASFVDICVELLFQRLCCQSPWVSLFCAITAGPFLSLSFPSVSSLTYISLPVKFSLGSFAIDSAALTH